MSEAKEKPWPLGPGKPRTLTLGMVVNAAKKCGIQLSAKNKVDVIELYKKNPKPKESANEVSGDFIQTGNEQSR